ncbi:MAG: nitrilase-related carbon-nitrogen hydrolase [candidate division FCPU426 bacterium]
MPMQVSVLVLLVQALMAFLAYPTPLLMKPNPVSALLLPLALAPVFLFVLLYRGRQAFLWTGLSVAAVVLLPTFHLTQISLFPVTGALLWLLTLALTFLLGGAYGSLGAFIFRRLPWSFSLSAPVLLCGEEFGRVLLSEVFSLVPPPSFTLSLPLAGWPPLIQMSAFTGLYGPALMVFFVGAVLAQVAAEFLARAGWIKPDLVLTAPQRRLAGLVSVAVAAGLLFLAVLGNADAMRFSRLQKEAQRVIRPALLQSQFDPSQAPEWGPPQRGFALRTYRQMCYEAVAKQAQVLVFTENALPLTLPGEQQAWQHLCGIFRETGLPAFVGLITTVGDEETYNVWYLISAQGEMEDHYIKRYLTPFGEYLPLRGLVDAVLGGVNALLNTSYKIFRITAIPNDHYDLGAGREEKVFAVAGARVSLKVCTETTIPRFFRQAVNQGAEVFFSPRAVNWFKTPVDWYLNMEACSFRAVESRRWIGLVASMGAAATVDALGVVRSETPYGIRAVDVPTLPLLDGLTFYARFGDLFAWLCVLVILLLVAFAATRRP